MIPLIKDDEVKLYELRRKHDPKAIQYEIRDLLEVENEYSEELIDLAQKLLTHGEYFDGDVRLNGSYKKKVLCRMQETIISLAPLYKYLTDSDKISFLAKTDQRAIPSLYSDLGLIQIILERTTFKESKTVPFDELSYQQLDEAENNTRVLQLINEFTSPKIKW